MKFRSTMASTALVASALTVPMLLSAPAHADTTTVEDVAFTCAYGPYSLAWTPDIAFDATWAVEGGRARITADFTGDLNVGNPMIPSAPTETTLNLKEHSDTDGDGSPNSRSGNLTGSDPAGFSGGIYAAPTVTGKPFSLPAALTKLSIEGVSVKFGTGESATTMACTLAAPVTVPDLAVSLPAATAGTAQLLCDTFGTRFYYPAAVTASATRQKETTTTNVTVALGNLPGLVPLTLTNTQITSALVLGLGETTFNANGAMTASVPAFAPIPVPAATGSVTSSASPIDVQLLDATFTAAVPGDTVNIPCDVAVPFTASGTGVTLTDSAACLAAKSAATTAAAALASNNAKVAADNAAVAKANAKVAKAKKALKKASAAKKAKAKKALKAAQKLLALAKAQLAGDANEAGKAASALAAANNSISANC